MDEPGIGRPAGLRDAAYADDVVGRLREAYEPAADAERAATSEAYLRGQFPFLGLTTPLRRHLAREALRGVPDPTEAQLAATTRRLWRQDEREFQLTGCDLVRAHVGVAGPEFLDVLRQLVTTRSWWDTVDLLAAHGVGPLVQRHPQLVAAMDEWIVDDDIWIARTALLHQLTSKAATDEARLFRYCRLRADEREFFLRKAIGWALRQHAAVAPDAVAEFVAATPTLSPLSRREALKGVARHRPDR